MKLDLRAEADRLAEDYRITDYDFWRMLKNLDNEIFRAASAGEPIAFDVIRWRAILRRARAQRGRPVL